MTRDYKNIGKAHADAVFLILAANPTTLALTQGFWGKIIYLILSHYGTWLASKELMVLNVGYDFVDTILQQKNFDGTLNEAYKIIATKGSTITPEEGAAIDNRVKSAFGKFAAFMRVRKRDVARDQSDN